MPPQRASDSSRGLRKFSPKDEIKIENLMPKIERTYLPLGSEVGKYRIIEEIDRGGMAVVYKALQRDLDRIVALKVLPANVTINRRFVDRFLAEAHSVAKLTHPNIVNIHEVAMVDNVYYLAMDYIPGKNLFYYLNSEKPKLVDVLEIIAVLADALAYAHHQQILHRDLKLNNIIMKDKLTPVLIDFGLAKALGAEDGGITQTGEIIGSPAYMAPERLMGKGNDARSDICSLGIMLYEMLTFKNPYLDPRSLHQTAMNVLESDPIPPRKLVSWLPIEVEAITLKAMKGDPELRYQTMEELRDDLRRYQRGEAVTARPPSLLSKARHFVRKYWTWAVVSVVTIAFSSLFAFYLYSQSRREQPHWQLVFSDEFDGSNRASWKVASPPGADSQGLWELKGGELRCHGERPTSIRLERSFTRDMLVEFDVRAAKDDLYNLGFFLYGNVPDSGYCFLFHAGGGAENGITYPGSGFLFYDADPLQSPDGNRFHVVIKRRERAISLTINEIPVAGITDYFPPLGDAHQKIGFFSKGGSGVFDNLKIYRLAVPQLPSRTMAADRFWERGDLTAAIEESKSLLSDFPQSQGSAEILLRMSDCLIRTARYDEARTIIDGVLAKGGNESERAQALFLQGALYKCTHEPSLERTAFFELSHAYPSNAANRSALAALIVEAADSLSHERIEAAESAAVALARQYPGSSPACGRISLGAVECYLARHQANKALASCAVLLKAYRNDPLTLARVHLRVGTAYLQKLDESKAKEAFNQCLSSRATGEAVWQAWLELADLYTYDFVFKDALKIYSKIYRECPKTVAAPWMARLRCGELAAHTATPDSAALFFAEVADKPHPFPVPRLIARYYRGALSEEQFLAAWCALVPKDPGCFYYVARKAAMEGRKRDGATCLARLKKLTYAGSWECARLGHVVDEAPK